jgi:very-short-patch-repair endonuclease
MSLLYTHPELAAQWHPTKNGDLKPSDVLAGSHDSVWWLCPKKCPEGCPHEWAAVIKSRVGMNAGCAVCDRKKICIHTSLLYTHPELAAQWHPTKNGKIKPSDVSAGSSYKAWWVCPIKTKKNSIHEWRAAIPNRTGQGQGCNICKHKTEKILYDFLIKLFPTLVKNKLLDNCKKIRCLPFDFEIPEKKTIIELDGAHHFKQVSNWKSNLITVKEDVFKMQKATERDYKIIRISQQDVFDNNVAWLEEHLLSEINSNDRNHMFISTIENLYDEHIRLYNRHIKIILDDITAPTPAPTAASDPPPA